MTLPPCAPNGFCPPSRNSHASCSPLLAPLGIAARPSRIPLRARDITFDYVGNCRANSKFRVPMHLQDMKLVFDICRSIAAARLLNAGNDCERAETDASST